MSIRNQGTTEEAFQFEAVSDFVGRSWFIRTVTYHLIGRAVRVVGQFLVLKDASWVADSGLFSEALKTGSLTEVEPVGDAIVNLNSVTDIFPWKHSLPDKRK